MPRDVLVVGQAAFCVSLFSITALRRTGAHASSRRPLVRACARPPNRPERPFESPEQRASEPTSSPTRLGTAGSAEPRINSALMQAMGDYFGDDGRELEDYAKRPRNAAGSVMLRVLLIGAGPDEVALAKVLQDSKRVRGLYYCPDEEDVPCPAIEPYANSSTVASTGMEDEVLRFCRWACVDVVFVGPSRNGCVGKDTEASLAGDGITLFSHDVSAAIAAGTLAVDDCFAAVSEELDAVAPPAEQLVE